MRNCSITQDQVFWYVNTKNNLPLAKDITTDVVIIGGGMAGLTAAQAFNARGLQVVLVEKNFCGAGASGKSSGFITPNSELSLYDITNLYGQEDALSLWNFAEGGVQLIKNNIITYNLECDYQAQDVLVVANSQKAYNKLLKPEYHTLHKLGYHSEYFSEEQITSVIGSASFKGAITYHDSFGIQAYKYCAGMKDVLQQQGVQIFEDTPVQKIEDKRVITSAGNSITANYIIVCVDHFLPCLDKLINEVYHVQTFLALSQSLSKEQIYQIFPEKRYMVWDTDLIYHYFRITGDNRLMFGGASLWYTYANQEVHNSAYMIKLFKKYCREKFSLEIDFRYMWPGLIGVSKDLMPIAGIDQNNPSLYYISGAAGLPWAAALGHHSATALLDNNTTFDKYFSPYRSFKIGPFLTRLLGKKLSFAVSHVTQVSSL